ncbi:ABC transporter permease [Tuwongella immobilis]|uniref:ABC3 transporter permease protein domain-containing protein n=1 Tax=Tuwongella immobilis TaxID=692036 RepID=A0A6C2YMY9_9BACT|nr:ABC transporter permease [Tuwongella immobilis]VIP02579.1 abc transporter atp-binding protein : ABC transport system ATP-binding protein/permease OS=uncultured planctomycete GN=HGMM_F09D09C23 PE=4 SV=1: MacB_PCD: FtsX [Tuwongella immobilis]VTS01826.1 abc transporter atp-binding protein : ABC transport system ATP-binding protein/permease OS=uncultured planctomycete GN=HGMM_F09D09C23 PE=4 SV=1: MacB_PCD: FtsX [Tuwongella immobilis]
MLNMDQIQRSFMLAIRSLWLHKLRAALSVLGIVIGTSAVIALMAFGEGSMQDALEDIRRQGATNIIVRSVKPADNAMGQSVSWIAKYGLTYEDEEALRSYLGDTLQRMVPMRVFNQEIRHYERRHNGRVVGTTEKYAEVNQLELIAGRFLSEDDNENLQNYAVLGSGTADALFPFEDPIGQQINIGRNNYQVIGVLKNRMPTGGSGGSQAAEDFNDDVYIPLKTCRAWIGDRIMQRSAGSRSAEQVELSQITITVGDLDQVRSAGEQIKSYLERSHLKKDWLITVPLDRLEEAERTKNRFTRLLVLIASISLVVGGIGIMNIMLATVTERTREIGIRRALGAKRRDITTQFLVEAVVQTSVGGLAGVVVGLSMTYIVPWLSLALFEVPLQAKVHVPSIFISVIVSIGVGVLFGLYPAQRAAKLDPIEALRHD